MMRIKAVMNDILGFLYIRPFITAIRLMVLLEKDYGHFLSSLRWASIDKNSSPIPWFSYPAIEYIKQLDLSGRTVFEYGSGNSTLFWTSKAKKVIAVESDPNWYRRIVEKVPVGSNVKIILAEQENVYVQCIRTFNQQFDVIIIDGLYRYKCAKEAIRKLKSGGFIILDNSNLNTDAAKILRNSGLIEVDMSGFTPIVPVTSLTSFFFHREFNFRAIRNYQPRNCIGN